MAQILDQDDQKIVFQNDDGTTTTVAKAAVSPAFAGRYGTTPDQPFSGFGSLVPEAQAAEPPPAAPQVPSPGMSLQLSGEAPQPVDLPWKPKAPELVAPSSPEAMQSPLAQSPVSSSPAIPKIPTAADSINKGIDMQMAAADKIGAAAAQSGVNQANALSAFNKQIDENQRKTADLEKRREAERLQFSQQLKDASDKIAQSANFKDFWADKSTGSKITAGIALALGSIGASMSGRDDQSVKILNDAIHRDIERQKAKYETARQGRTDVMDAYSMAMKQYGDRETALNAALDMGYRKTQLELERYAKLAQSPEAKAKAEAMKGQLEVLRGETIQKATDAAAKKADEKRELFVPGLQQFATSKEGAQKMNELIGATESAKGSINKLISLARTPGSSLTPEIRAQADTEARMAQAALRVPILGPGTVQENERKLLETIVADPTRIFSMDSTNQARLSTLLERLDKNVGAQGKAYGINSSVNQGPAIGTPRN